MIYPDDRHIFTNFFDPEGGHPTCEENFNAEHIKMQGHFF